jgi:hypothetical protein
VIVVDTTVWIDFLEARGTTFDRHLTELLESDAPIALVDIVYCEILQGIRDDDVYHRTRLSLLAHPILQPRGLETFEVAANLYRPPVAEDSPFDEASTASSRPPVSSRVSRCTTMTATSMRWLACRAWRFTARHEHPSPCSRRMTGGRTTMSSKCS